MTVEEWLNNDELALKIWHNKYQYNNESFDEWLSRVSGNDNEVKRLILEKKFIFGGRTLANRNTNNGDYSNCFTYGRVGDSLDDIMQAAKDIAVTFKAQGGQGLSLSDIRPKGSLIKDNFKSDGILPFMEIFNTVTASISQGSHRRGALLMSLDVEHPEIELFISVKDDLNKINNANLSVEISDRFMEAVKKYYSTGEVIEYVVPNRFKGNNPNGYKICPIKIYKKIIEHAWKTGEPGVLFMQRMKNYNLMQYIDEYNIQSTNPCGEQPMCPGASCNLCSINLSEYIINPFTNNAHIDYKSLKKDIATIVMVMDDLIDENVDNHPLEFQREVLSKYRNIGIGIMGLHDMLIKLGLVYGSKESIVLVEKLMHKIFRYSVKASAELALERGVFKMYNESIFNSDIIKEHFCDDEIDQLKTKGLRNCSLLSIAPTGLTK